MAEISDEELRALWSDPTFPGHYSGIRYFQDSLKYIRNINVSQTRIRKVLNSIRNYQLHIRGKKRGERRHYNVSGYGELVQGDLAFMWGYENMNSFLLITDAYSMNIYTRALKDKKANTTLAAINDIFTQDLKMFPEKFETDQGGEFNASICKQYYKKNNIYYHQKTGINKASFAEHAIFVVKRKLFMMMRQKRSTNWPVFLKVVTDNLNLQPRPALGYMSPAQIQSPMDDPTVERAKQRHHVPERTDPSAEEQKRNQDEFNKSDSPFKVGNYVYKNFLPQKFDKSYDTQVSKTVSTFVFI